MRRAIQTHAAGAVRLQSCCHQTPRAAKVTQVRLNSSTALRSASVSQTKVFEGYSADLLDAPLRSVAPGTVRNPPIPTSKSQEPVKSEQDEVVAKARVVFGSRLAGPGERKAAIDAVSTNIAGVLVPPRPEEPDNCCIGGCVNCVWVQYRCEMEDWASKSTEARRRLQALKAKDQTGEGASMDDDGGPMGDFLAAGKDMYEGIPVGIRAFMETEKAIREKQALQQAASL